MEPRSFDALARSLATAKTRRGLLGALAAFGTGLLGAKAADAQVTQAQCGNLVCYNRATQTPTVACGPGCVCCVYGNGNSRCQPPGGCTGSVVSPTTTTTTLAPTTTTAAPTTTTTTTTGPFLPLQGICISADQCDQSGGTTLCDNNGCGGADGPIKCCRPLGGSCGDVCDCCSPNFCNGGTCGPQIG